MPRLAFLPHALLFIGPLGRIESHTHAAPAVVVGAESPFELDGGKAGGEPAQAYWVPPGLRHALDPRGQPTAVCYFEPGSALATQVRRRWPAHQAFALADTSAAPAQRSPWVAWAQAAAQAPAWDEATVRSVWERVQWLCAPSGGQPASRPADPRVMQVLDDLQQAAGSSAWAGDDHARPQAAQWLADGVALSPSRLRHLFTPEAGTPLRRYRLWCRLVEAARRAMQGQTLTQAALEAGFSDAPHFSRAFKAMFGLAPSQVQRMPDLEVLDLGPATTPAERRRAPCRSGLHGAR